MLMKKKKKNNINSIYQEQPKLREKQYLEKFL